MGEKEQAFRAVMLGHTRGHGCRDLLIYCASIDCNHSSTMNADHLPDDFAYWLTLSPYGVRAMRPLWH